jgi:hypothetical protein
MTPFNQHGREQGADVTFNPGNENAHFNLSTME